MLVRTFRDVIELWPSPDALAGDIGASFAAVRKWPQRGKIPAEWWVSIVGTKIARDAGLTIEMMATLAQRPSTAAKSLEGRACP